MNKIVVLIFLLSVIACNNTTKEKKLNNKQTALPEAVKSLMQLSKQFPDSVGLHLRLVNAMDSLGDYPTALHEMDLMIQKDSGNFGLWFKKAELKTAAKDTIGAIHAYSKAVSIYASPDAQLALANLYAETKDRRSLILCSQVADLRMGRTYQAHCDFISAVYFARTGNYTKAIQGFNQCILNNYTYMEAYMEKGFIFYDNKQLDDAIKVFQTVITIKNNYPDGYYWLGKCFEAKKNRPSAIENYEKAFSLDPQLHEAETAIKRLKN